MVIKFGERLVGDGQPCFIIAEAGVNHNGDPVLAERLVEVAAECGADAVKFQTFVADRLVTSNAPRAEYQIAAGKAPETQLEMLRRLELPFEAYDRLVDLCSKRGILFMSTPFDEESADFLDRLSMQVFKIPSGEITNLPLIQHVAQKGKPMVVSTGMSTMQEVGQAVQTIENTGNRNFVLLQCVSNYPADPATANLRAMKSMADTFKALSGYSDHCPGTEVSLAAVALGACVIEKHFTLDRSLPGPDHKASLEPDELKGMIQGIRRVEAALGDGHKAPSITEANVSAVARRSLVAASYIAAGTILTEDMIAIKRPGTGLLPSMRSLVIGRKAARDIPSGTVLSPEMFA